MAWNEPGNNGGKDPWGSRDSDKGPPDLDEVVKKVQDKLGGIFGGGGGQGRRKTTKGSPGLIIIILIVAAILIIWEISYIVEPAERGVVLRFGKYHRTLEPGLNFVLPRPIDAVGIVDVDQIRTVSHKATMLTRDENIVDVELAVQYRVKDVIDFLFKVRGPEPTLRQVTEAALRETIGFSTLDFVLTEGRAEIATLTKDLIQKILDNYQTGLLVTSVNMQPAKPPEEVKEAFDDAIKAREDKQRLINESESYSNEVIPKARGAAARLRAEAEAYKFQVMAVAEGDAQRFSQLMNAYAQAPEVTRQRLYLDALESVIGKSSKVIIDSKGSNNLIYLPLDKLIDRKEEQNLRRQEAPPPAESLSQEPAEPADLRQRNIDRLRSVRQ